MHEHLKHFGPVFSRCGFQPWHRLVWSVTRADVLPLNRKGRLHIPLATSNSNGVGLGGGWRTGGKFSEL